MLHPKRHENKCEIDGKRLSCNDDGITISQYRKSSKKTYPSFSFAVSALAIAKGRNRSDWYKQ
jgi:uncharacterized protein (UPF0332 family)